jgi:hypothetical protein
MNGPPSIRRFRRDWLNHSVPHSRLLDKQHPSLDWAVHEEALGGSPLVRFPMEPKRLRALSLRPFPVADRKPRRVDDEWASTS